MTTLRHHDHDEGEPARADLVLRGGTVVTVDDQDRIVDGDVAIAQGKIVALGPDLEEWCRHAGRVMDVSGCVVLPGFVNAHMHECMERGVFEDLEFMTWLEDFALPKDRAYEPRHQRAAALVCQAEMIRNGTTSFIDIFRHPGMAAQVALDSGLRATFSPQVIDDPEEGAGETLATNEAFVAEWYDRHPRIRAWFGPHSLYTVRASTLRQMRSLADSYGVGIHTHLAESRVETTLVADRAGGLSPTRWLDELIGLGPDVVVAHAIELDDDDLARVASSQLGVAHCPTSNMKLGNGAARVVDLLDAGAVVGLGTDSVMTNNNLDPFEEMRQAGLLAKFVSRDATALDSHTLLRLATAGSAQVLGLGDQVGSIEIGKRADLAVVDLSQPHAWPLFTEGGGNVVEQLVWSMSGRDVKMTIVDGVVLYEDGHLLTLEIDEIADLVTREEEHLLRSAGVFDHVVERHRRDRPPR